MFKGILPSKRLPSAEFTMVTTLGDISNGKENVPDLVSAAPAKVKDRAKHEKSKSVKTSQDFSVEPIVTDQAFNRLLASGTHRKPSGSNKKMNRTIYKFRPLSVQSLPTWMLP